MKYKREVVRAVLDFKRTRPWRGSLEERKAKFGQLHQTLCQIYAKSTALVFEVSNSESSGNSHFIPAEDKITLVGKLSFVTYLHEFAHALGKDERGACLWSVNLFVKCFPRQFARCRAEGHMLIAGGSPGTSQPASIPMSQTKIVSIHVEGGVVQNIDVPDGVVVKVMDYDGEEFPARDDIGRPCNIRVWEH
jgi:hypothetical protein